MFDKSNSLLYVQLVVLVGSIIATVFFVRKAINFHGRPLIGIPVFFICLVAFIHFGTTIPLSLHAESERVQYNLTVDLIMYGSIGLLAIGIAGFAVDHIFERPTFLVMAAAALLSIGLLPFYYKVRCDDLNHSYEIKIVEPVVPKQTIPPPRTPGLFK